jgi:hypothetical protein
MEHAFLRGIMTECRRAVAVLHNAPSRHRAGTDALHVLRPGHEAPGLRKGDRRSGEGEFHNLGKCGRVADREFGKNLPINVDLFLVQCRNQS